MNTTPIDHKIEFMVFDKEFEQFLIRKKFNVGRSYIWVYCLKDGTGGQNSLEWCINNEDGFGVMQLTALRSINDEPIYNHMIVRSETGLFYCVDMFDYPLMFLLSNDKLEIVGNRFQHSELLELCQ